MKKIVAGTLVAMMLMASAPVTEAREPGGFMGFVAGCCFGIRTAGAWNDGKDIHFREWGLLIPIVGIVITIWNGIDGAQGITTRDLASQYGANFY